MRNLTGTGNVQQIVDTRRLAALALLAGMALSAGMVLSGCAAGGGPSSEATVGSPNPSSSDVPASPGTTQPGSTKPGSTQPVGATPRLTSTPLTPDPFPGELTVRGAVQEGVEVGCMILAADDGK